MRTFYNTWNKDNPDDNVVFSQLDEMSQGRLKEELAYLRQNGLVESTPRDKGTNVERYQRNLQSGRGNFQNNNRERNNNNNRNAGPTQGNNNNNNNNNRNRDRDRDKFRSNKNNRRR
jgi:DNA-binding PadR family transcriptional regulator